MFDTIEDFLAKVSYEGIDYAIDDYGLDVEKHLTPEAKASNPDFVEAWKKLINSPRKQSATLKDEINRIIARDYPDSEEV